MASDISGISYFAPLLAFLIVFIIMFALLNKTKLLGENAWVQLFVSFLVSTIFVSAAGVREYVLTITPWFAVLIVSLFFVLFIIGFVGKDAAFMHKGIGIISVLLLVVVFLVSGFVVFSAVLTPYLPGSSGTGANPDFFRLTRDIYGTRVFGAMLLLGISALVSWVLVKSSK